MTRRDVLLVLVCLTTAPVYAADRATKGGAFLELPVGAREIGLGRTGVSHADGPVALKWNPALMGRDPGQRLSVSRAERISTLNQNFAGIDGRGKRGRGFGVAVDYLDVGSIDQTDDVGSRVGSFSPKDFSLAVGWSRQIHWLRAGVAGRYVQSKIIHSASTWSGDVGVSAQFLSNRLGFGLSAQNLFGRLEYVEATEALSKTIRAGSHFTGRNHLTLAVDLVESQNEGFSVGTGVEKALHASKDVQVRLRGGLNSAYADGKDGAAGLTLGGGVRLKRLSIDYGWVPLAELGGVHFFTLTVGGFGS